MTSVREVAFSAHSAGISVVPPTEDGQKKPAGAWERWQRERAPLDVLNAWYGPRTGVGFVCGQISGGLELLEFDERETYERFRDTAEASGLAELIERIEAGYLEDTPGGGVHWLYHVAGVHRRERDEGGHERVFGGNTKLARRPKRPEEMQNPKDTVKVLIETRGEGGYVVAAPSNGKVHPTGGAYRLLRGGVETIATITEEEREDLFALAGAFDQMPREAEDRRGSGKTLRYTEHREGDQDIKAGDDFNVRATWEEVLEPAGWRVVYRRGEITAWRRPGKNIGVSATTNFAGSDLFYPFTTSSDFDSEKGYSKWRAYAILNHGGDWSAAGKALFAKGYGVLPKDEAGPGQPTDDAVLPFPLEALPPAFRTLVQRGAAALPAPPDFIAVPLLTGAGAALGDAMELELKPGWREGANITTASVGDPGSKKTPSMNLALHSVYRIQKRLARDYDREMETFKAGQGDWEATEKKQRGRKPEPPTFQHVVTTDITVESVANSLQSAKGLLVAKDELTGWVKSMDQYRAGGKGSDRQHYLSMWSRSLIKVDRKGAPKPIVVARPHLSVTGGIQPDMLPELGDATQREDGFLDRVLFCFPDKVPDRWTEESVGLDVQKPVEEIFDRLYALRGVKDSDGEVRPMVVYMNAEARKHWVDWYEEHIAESATEDFPRRLVGPWAKMPAQLARLALILHAAGGATDAPLAAVTLGAAADLVDYFKSHVRRVYRHLGHQRRDRVVTLLKALKESGPLNKRAILHDVFQRNIPAGAVDAMLEELEDAGLARREVEQGDVGRPATVWRAV